MTIESIGIRIEGSGSPTHICGTGPGGRDGQQQVCSPIGFLACKWSSCPRSRSGGRRRGLLAAASRCSLTEHPEHRRPSIVGARPPEKIRCPE